MGVMYGNLTCNDVFVFVTKELSHILSETGLVRFACCSYTLLSTQMVLCSLFLHSAMPLVPAMLNCLSACKSKYY